MAIVTEMLHDPIFMISLSVTIVILLLWVLSRRSVRRCKVIGTYLLLLLFLSGPVLGFNILVWSRSDVNIYESRTREYKLIVRWIDQGGFGYMPAEVMIAKPGFFGARRGIGYSTPLSVVWISDDAFAISEVKYGSEGKILYASDFFERSQPTG